MLPATALLAQETVTGSVVDSAGAALPGATLLLINPADSSVVGYGVADQLGAFSIPTQRTGSHWLQARVVGFLVGNKTITLPSADSVNFILRVDPKEIESVRIKGTMRGFKQRGDTLTYDPKAFTTGMEKTLADLLAKLPGLQVSADGSVKAQGKTVEKILFGGRDLFGDNVGLATKNISADVADSVRVIHGYSEYNVLDGFESHDKTVLDIGVNESMWNKLTGELRAAGGYRNVYDGKAQTMYLGKQFMLNFQALANNTGAPLFSYSDYLAMQGGAQRIDGGYSISIRTDNALYKLINPPSDTYKKCAELAMLHMGYNIDKRLKLNFGAVATGLMSHSQSRAERLFTAGPLTGKQSISILEGADRTGLLFATLAATYSPTERATIQYSISSDYSENNDSSNGSDFFAYDTTCHLSRSTSRPLNLSTALSGAFRVGSHLLSVNVAYDISNALNDSYFAADTLLLPLLLARSEGQYRLGQQRQTKRQAARVDATMKFRLTDAQFLSLGVSDAFTCAQQNLQTSNEPALQRTAALFDAPWHAESLLDRNDLALALAWIRNKGLFQFTIGLEGHYYQAWHNLPSDFSDQRRFALLPSAELKLHFASMHDLTLSYSETITPNALHRFLPAYTLRSLQSLAQRGLASRLYAHTRSVALSYDLFHTPSTLFINAHASSSWTNGLAVAYDAYGVATISHAIDGATTRSTSAHLILGKTVASFWELNGVATWRNSDSYFYVANDALPYTQHTASGSASVKTIYKSVVNGRVSGSISATFHRVGEEVQWRRALEWRAMAGLDIKYKGFSALVESGYRVAPGHFDATRTIPLDVELAYEFPYEVTLSAIGRNLLYMASDRYSNEHLAPLYLERRIYGKMPGYAMLQLRWKFGGKAKGKDFSMSVVNY